MLEQQTDWKKYEQYTKEILNDPNVNAFLMEHFKLPNIKFQPKKELKGKSGTYWEVDSYGEDDKGNLILIECKHHKNEEKRKNVDQNIIAAFAYIIKDVGAKSGIIVTTNGLQEGAITVAENEGIEIVLVDKNSTDANYVVHFPKNNQAIALFTDTFGGGFSLGAGKSTYNRISGELLNKAHRELIRESRDQGINKEVFTTEEITEKAKRMKNS